MAKCIDCGKKLGILEGYHHLTFGKRWFFCKKCYDKIDEKGSPLLQKIEKNRVLKDTMED